MLGDQEVLTALLGSRPFGDVPLRLLQRGREIVHSGNAAAYTVRERLENLRHGLPPFLHAMRLKPWSIRRVPAPTDPMQYFQAVYAEISPYTCEARTYRGELGEPCEWMEMHALPAKLLRFVARRNASLQGVPQAAAERALWRMRSLRR